MKVLIGMSGGVDSTYAAYKLLSEGHEVEGAVIKMHEYTDVTAARSASCELGIPLHVIDCTQEFEELVVSNFISEYKKGRTPNPCIVCNSEIKLESLLDFALEHGFDAIATGHYAAIDSLDTEGGKRYFIRSAADSAKDQTYVLWRLSQRVLSHLTFPLSDTTKAEVRAHAMSIGLKSWDKGDSQEICFIPDGDYAGFIEARTEASPPGNFVDEDGHVLGQHKGIINYTVGQRKGLGIALGSRVFVSEINPYNNNITLSDTAKTTYSFTVSGVVLSGLSPDVCGEELRLLVKYRYLSPRLPARVRFLGGGRAEVELEEPARSLTPGQSAVFYLGDAMVAGGFID